MKKLILTLIIVIIAASVVAQKEKSITYVGRSTTGFNKLSFIEETVAAPKVKSKHSRPADHSRQKMSARRRKRILLITLGLVVIIVIPVLLISDSLNQPFSNGL